MSASSIADCACRPRRTRRRGSPSGTTSRRRPSRRDRDHARREGRAGSPVVDRAGRRGASSSAPRARRAHHVEVEPHRRHTLDDPDLSRHLLRNELRSGQPATVKAIVTSTSLPAMSTERTMSSSVTGFRSSGSMTLPRAARTASRVTAGQGASAVANSRAAQLGCPRRHRSRDRAPTGRAAASRVGAVHRVSGSRGPDHELAGREVDGTVRLRQTAASARPAATWQNVIA